MAPDVATSPVTLPGRRTILVRECRQLSLQRATVLHVSADASSDRPTSRWRSSQPPVHWNSSTRPSAGVVELPLRLYWSDGHNRFDLGDESERRLLYQIVLTEGSANDVREFLDLATLLRIWDQLWLPAAVHDAWDAWVAAHRHVAV